jgi:hypothetical protein
VLSSQLCGLNQTDRAAFDAKFVSKNLNDSFLPIWNMTSLRSRLGFSQGQASLFLTAVGELQGAGCVPRPTAPSSADYDAVASSIILGEYGNQQQCIDAYVRSNGVLCSNSTLSRRVNSAGPTPRRSNLSQASINMISDLMFAATSATDCKPANSARRFVRAFAMLERRFGSAAEYLQRNRQLPPDAIFMEGSVSRSSQLPMLYPANAVFNPRHAAYPYPGVDSATESDSLRSSLSQKAASETSVQSSTQATQTGEPAAVGSGDSAASDNDENVPDDTGLRSVHESDDSDYGGDEEAEAAEEDELSDVGEIDDTLAPLVWNGPAPRDNPGNKLNMRYPRKTQLSKMMKEHGWSSYKGQWVEKHRRNGADPQTLDMYFDETEKCKERNGITATEELNGDESLFKGEVTDMLRNSKFLVCRGPRASAAEMRNRHAWTTAEGTPDKVALVATPVISRVKCHLLQAILKGNPNPKSAKQREKQRRLAEEVRNAYPSQLRDVIYVAFTKTGYQTAESWKDLGRALLVALHKEESPSNSWMNIATTPMSDMPRCLQKKFLFKFDGSSTHCLNDHRFLLELSSRGVIPWPYTPNATAFLQELDQLCFWIFKNSARKIMKLEIEFNQEKSDLRNLFLRMTWLDDVINAYRAELDEHTAQLTSEHRVGHKGFDKYACRPDALEMLNGLCERKGMPWGPVRLAKMLGWSLGQALLTPSILEKSFDAVTRERVFRRPLVARELLLHDSRRLLQERKLSAMSELAVAMADGNASSLSLPEAARLPAAVVLESIADEKWTAFQTHVLRGESNPDMRQLCTLFNSFSIAWEASAKSQEKRDRFLEMFRRNDDPAALLDAANADDARAREALVSGFFDWLQTHSSAITALETKLENLEQVALPGAESFLVSLLAGAGELTAQSTQKQRGTVQKQGVAVTRAVNGITSALDDVADRAAKLLSTVQSRKQKMFPTAASPAPDTFDFDSAHGNLLLHVSALRAAIAAFNQRDTYERPPAPALVGQGGARGGRGRGGGAGRGRGGRGGAQQVAAAAPAAAELAAASSNDDDNEVSAAVIEYHEQRLRQQEARIAAERDERDRRYAEEQAALDES